MKKAQGSDKETRHVWHVNIPLTRNDRAWEAYVLNDAFVRAPREMRKTAKDICKLINNADEIHEYPATAGTKARYAIHGLQLVASKLDTPNTRYRQVYMIEVMSGDKIVATVTKPWLINRILCTLAQKQDKLQKHLEMRSKVVERFTGKNQH